MRRLATWPYLFPVLLAAAQVLAQGSDNVQVTLALKDGKTTYRMGEAIVLDLSFTANDPGHLINSSTQETDSPIDEITILPADGVFPWLAGGITRASAWTRGFFRWGGTVARCPIAHFAASERGLSY
jgi:hypothetical protein